MPKPRISVVIPCYNGARFVGEAVDSVLSQRYPATDIIVVDDGSVDSSLSILSRHPSVRTLRQPHAGVAVARNTGLQHSTGDYIAFLDQDDRLLPDALRSNLECLLARPHCAFSFGDAQCIAVGGGTLPIQSSSPHEGEEHYLSLLRGSYIWTPGAVLHRRAVLQTLSGFDVHLGPVCDTDLHLRIASLYPICHNPTVVVEKRIHDANQSRDCAILLMSMIQVFRTQKQWVHHDRRSMDAIQDGVRSYLSLYGKPLAANLVNNIHHRREWRRTCMGLLALLQYASFYVLG